MNATLKARTSHSGTHAAVRRAALRSFNRRKQEDHYLNAAAYASRNSIKSISYTYNTLDCLTGYSSTNSLQAGTTSATYTYDTRQLRKTGESINYGGFSLAVGTTYNSLGQKQSSTYPDGATYSYTYDGNNQLSTVSLPQGYGSITINSYQWLVPSQITYPGGAVRNQDYDGLLRLKDFSVKDPGQSQLMNWQYGYDLTGNISSKATEQGSSTGSLQAITAYSYDTLDHLTGATYSGSSQANESYTYDGVDNRTASTTGVAQTIASYDYNANNQLTLITTSTGMGSTGSPQAISYTYDDNGNTINQTDSANPANTRNYVWDTDNRLIEVRDANNSLIAAYSYDPFGRRISKDAGTSKTFYLYSEEGLIAEADASGQITKSYGYAPQSDYGTQPLFMRAGNNYYYYQLDHLGTPQQLTSQSGQVVWRAMYDAYGNATVDPGSSITNNLRFPGQYFDAETGLHYNWMRYYDPNTGRYIASDPIRLNGGINFYVYSAGSPIRWIDSYGLCLSLSDQWIDVIAGGVGGGFSGFVTGGPWGAATGIVLGAGGTYITQQLLLNNVGGKVAVGLVGGYAGNSSNFRGRRVGALTGAITAAAGATMNPGDWNNTTGGLFAGTVGGFVAEGAVRASRYSSSNRLFTGAIMGGWSGLVGGFFQDITTMMLKSVQCQGNSNCEKR